MVNLRPLLLLLSLLAMSTVASCSGLNPLGLLSGGTNVAANTQLGKNNLQSIGTTKITGDQKISNPQSSDIRQTQNDSKVAAEKVGTVVVQERDNFMFFVLLICFIAWSYFLYLLPSPDQLWRKKK